MQIIAILLSALLVLFSAVSPFKIKKFPVNMVTTSLLSLVILFALGVIDLPTLKLGILGNGVLRPWEIILIFFTVAYISISTDITGIFDLFAYKIVRKANGDGFKLFLFFYFFAAILTLFTSNDIVILTLTPIIFYLGNHAKLNILPLLYAEFFGANTLSMALYIGNPTNIIVGNTLSLGFLEFTQTMWFPTLVAATLNLLFLFLYFRRSFIRNLL